MKNKIIAFVKIAIGVIMAAAVLIGYLPIPQCMVEFTFITNTLGSLLIICDGIMDLNGKSVPGVLYRNVCAGIFFVFAICMGSLSGAYQMNFEGAFFMLHVVTPILFIAGYIFLYDDNDGKAVAKLLTTPILMIVYMLCDFILGKTGGSFVYGFFRPDEVSITDALIIGAVFYVMMFAIGALFLFLNRAVHKNAK